MVHNERVRADAQRNRDRILRAARDLVAETGAEATMEDIARRAGVAVGTLYRHFPAKEDLVTAVVDDSAAWIAALAESALAAVDAGAAVNAQVRTLFRAVLDRHATDRAFKAAAGRLEPDVAKLRAAPAGSAEARAVAAITALLDRARTAGAVRPDLTLGDLVMLLCAAPGAEVPAAMRDRWADIVFAGLSAVPGT